MVVVVLLDFGQVADQGHLDSPLASSTHTADIPLKAVVFVNHLEARRLQERGQGRDGNVQLHVDAGEKGLQLFVHVPVKGTDFFGAVFTVRRKQVLELVQHIVEFPTKAPFERLENLVEQFRKNFVPFEIPDGNWLREHPLEGVLEILAHQNPTLAVLALAVRRHLHPEFHVLRRHSRHPLQLADFQPVAVQERTNFLGLFLSKAGKHVLRNPLEQAFHLYRTVRVVKEGHVQGKWRKQPADSHKNIGFTGIVVAYQGGHVVQGKRLPLDRPQVTDGNFGQA